VDVVESVIGLDLDGDGQKGHGHGMGLVDGLEAVTGKDNCTAIPWNHGFLYARTQHFLHLLLVLKVLVAAWGHFHCLWLFATGLDIDGDGVEGTGLINQLELATGLDLDGPLAAMCFPCSTIPAWLFFVPRQVMAPFLASMIPSVQGKKKSEQKFKACRMKSIAW
jgi:hypothetical protein